MLPNLSTPTPAPSPQPLPPRSLSFKYAIITYNAVQTVPAQICLLRFRRLVSSGANVGSSGATLGEVAREYWLHKGAEDNLCASVFTMSNHANREVKIFNEHTQIEEEPSTGLVRI